MCLPFFVEELKITGPRYSVKIKFSNFQNALFSCFAWELWGIILIFGSTTQFYSFWYTGCVMLLVSTYHAKIHVEFQNLTKICKILVSIVMWVKSTRIWPSGCEVRAVWSSTLTAFQKPYPLWISDPTSPTHEGWEDGLEWSDRLRSSTSSKVCEIWGSLM